MNLADAAKEMGRNGEGMTDEQKNPSIKIVTVNESAWPEYIEVILPDGRKRRYRRETSFRNYGSAGPNYNGL